MPVVTLEIRRVRISMQVLPMSAITSLPATLTSDRPSDCFAPSIAQRYRMALYRLCGKSIEMIRLRASRNARFVAFEVRSGSISTELSYPHHVRSTPDSDRRADVPVRQLCANSEVVR